jgi:diguanylate cyclase (GGDEF)-like protein
MKDKIRKLGRGNATVLFTILSVLVVLGLDLLLVKLLSHEFNQSQDLLRAAIITIMTMPVILWYLFGFMDEIYKKNKEIDKSSTYDSLTGLFKRQVFFSSCEKLHNYSVRKKEPYCIIDVDMDGFKQVNEKYGRECADRVLKTFAALSQETARDSDIIARLGGEEFVYFLPNTRIEQAEVLAKRLAERIHKKPVISGSSYVQYSISVGISSNKCVKNETFENVLKRADDALHVAKEKGGNRIEIYNKETAAQNNKQLI